MSVKENLDRKKKKDKNDEDVQLEITEVIIVHWNIINNQYDLDSRVLSCL